MVRLRVRSLFALRLAALLPVLLGSTTPSLLAQVVINEVLAINNESFRDDEDDSSDWIELLNTGTEPVDLAHFAISDDPRDVFKWRFPESILGPGEFATVWASGKDRIVPSESTVTAINSPVEVAPTILSLDHEWRYLTGSPDEAGPPAAWMQPDFDDSDWPSGKPGFGFGDDDDTTVLPEGIGAVFLRTTILVEDLKDVEGLILEILYDDGFALFLNGEPVLSRYVARDDPLTFASTATTSHEARRPQRFIVSDWAEHFRVGENTLAAAALNRTPTNADLSFAPLLGTVPPVFHTNFEIDGSGEAIFLSDQRVQDVVDAVNLPEQRRDRSYGRFPDGTGDFAYMLIPTPEAANDSRVSQEPLATTITLDPPPGLHSEAVAVSLSANIPFEGFEIRYTLDGRVPRATSPLYERPINVSRNTTIRANGFIAGEPDPLLRPTSGSYFRSFNNLRLPVVAISMEPADFQAVHNNSGARGPASERPGHFEVLSSQGNLLASTGFGIRLHGGAGRNGGFSIKKAYKAYFRGVYGDTRLRMPLIPDTHIESFDKLVLRANFNDAFRTGQDAALIRDQVIRDLHGDMGQIYSHGSWYNLFVNMQYRGVYNVVERMDKRFFASYFPEIGEEWDVIKTGNDVLDGSGTDFSRMLQFFRASDLRDRANFEEAERILDIENYTSYMILNIWAQNHDWPHNNWYAAKPRVEGGRWIFLSWDAEFGLGRNPGGFSADTLSHTLSRASSSVAIPLVSLLRSPTYGEYFLSQVERYLEGPLSPTNVLRRVDQHASTIRPDIPEEAAVTSGSASRWESNIRAVRTFASRRPGVVRNFCFSSSRIPNPRVLTAVPNVVDLGEDLEVSLRGTRLSADLRVFLGDIETEILESPSSRQIVVAVPADIRLEGDIDIRVESATNGGYTTRGALTGRIHRPSVTSITPAMGPASGGNWVEVQGEGFDETTRVEFDGVQALDSHLVGELGEALLVMVPPGFGTVTVRAINEGPLAGGSIEEITYIYQGGTPPSFLRGDCDGDGRLSVSDAVCALGYLFDGVTTVSCVSALDHDDDGNANLSDVVLGLAFLFRQGEAPAAPFPSCGADPSADLLLCRRSSCD